MMDLYYNNIFGSLVFAPPKVAENNAAIHCALGSKTWGEFKSLLPDYELETIIEERADTFEETVFALPSDDDSIDVADWCPGIVEGDYPEWLMTRQSEWIPPDILEKFGMMVSSFVNGSAWEIDASCEADIVACLADRGISATRRNDLAFR